MAINRNDIPLQIPAQNGSGASQDVSFCAGVSVFVSGTFTADIQIQISPQGISVADGQSSWFNVGAVLNAPGFVEFARAMKCRATVANYVNGTPAGAIVGTQSVSGG